MAKMGGRKPGSSDRTPSTGPDLCPGPDLASQACRECLLLADLLAKGVPVSLIMDLAMPGGPHSRELLVTEGLPDGPWWGGCPAA